MPVDRKAQRADKQARGATAAANRVTSAKARVVKAAGFSGGQVLVALSGGKDSLVTLDLCCAHFEHVEAFYLYLVAGLQTFEAPVDAAARRHGVKVHKVPHFDLPRLIKYAVLRPHVPNAASIRELRWIDINNAMREQTGIPWIAAGERATDSMQRRFYTREYDGVQPQHKRVFPIWDWVDADVFGYLRARGIGLPSYGAFTGLRGSGFSLEGKGLSWLKHANPEDYNRVLKVFPYAEAEVLRYERSAARAQEQAERVPKVRAPASKQKRPQGSAVQPEGAAQPPQAAKA